MEIDNTTKQVAPPLERQFIAPLPENDQQNAPFEQNATTQEQLENTGFRCLTHVAPFFLLLLVAAQVWPDFWQAYLGTALYCPAEAQHIRIAQEVAQASQFFAPTTSLSAQWPAYTWLLLALGELLPPAEQWLVYPVASTCPAFLALLAVWVYSRVAGFGASAAFAAMLTTLCAPLFAPLVHFVGPSALATTLMLLSLTMFCRGWQADSAWLALAGAFVFAGLAGLSGGPFFLLVPLATSFVFLCWRCTFRRGHGLDAIFGFLLLLLIVAGWLGCVILFTHAEQYMQELFGSITQPWNFPRPFWWLPLTLASIGLAPWLAVVCCASWSKAIQGFWPALQASRKERAGVSFVWLSFVTALALAVIIPGQSAQPLAIALLCLATPLVGKTLMTLSFWGRRFFVGITAILLLLVGALLIGSHFENLLSLGIQSLSWDGKDLLAKIIAQIQILPVMGVGCIVAALPMMCFCRRSTTIGGFLLYCSIMVTLFHQPATLIFSPALGNIPEAGLCRMQQQTLIRADESLENTGGEMPSGQEAADIF